MRPGLSTDVGWLRGEPREHEGRGGSRGAVAPARLIIESGPGLWANAIDHSPTPHLCAQDSGVAKVLIIGPRSIPKSKIECPTIAKNLKILTGNACIPRHTFSSLNGGAQSSQSVIHPPPSRPPPPRQHRPAAPPCHSATATGPPVKAPRTLAPRYSTVRTTESCKAVYCSRYCHANRRRRAATRITPPTTY